MSLPAYVFIATTIGFLKRNLVFFSAISEQKCLNLDSYSSHLKNGKILILKPMYLVTEISLEKKILRFPWEYGIPSDCTAVSIYESASGFQRVFKQ